MFHTYAEILGRHAADVLHRMSGIRPSRIDMTEEPATLNQQAYHLSVMVRFTGDSQGQTLAGFLVFGFARHQDALPLAKAVTAHLGLPTLADDDQQGLTNVLSELLNTIIGLTGAGWAQKGLTINFDPPEVNVGCPLPPPHHIARTYQLVVEAENYPDMNIAIRFLPGSPSA